MAHPLANKEFMIDLSCVAHAWTDENGVLHYDHPSTGELEVGLDIEEQDDNNTIHQPSAFHSIECDY